jgi:hypothetical protein
MPLACPAPREAALDVPVLSSDELASEHAPTPRPTKKTAIDIDTLFLLTHAMTQPHLFRRG